MRSIAAAVCLLAATACSEKAPVSPTPVDARVILAPGQTAQVASGVTVRFITVSGDSRCPADAFCVLGGDAIVRVEIATAGKAAERELHTGNNQPVDFESVRVELIQLEPYPFSATPIRPSDYRATLRVTR